jgi:hypothetical protein
VNNPQAAFATLSRKECGKLGYEKLIGNNRFEARKAKAILVT